jgi:hypothetical protein
MRRWRTFREGFTDVSAQIRLFSRALKAKKKRELVCSTQSVDVIQSAYLAITCGTVIDATGLLVRASLVVVL